MASTSISLSNLKQGNNIIDSKDVNNLQNEILNLTKKLEEIKLLAGKEQGRWIGCDDKSLSPEWTIPFKKIIQIIEN